MPDHTNCGPWCVTCYWQAENASFFRYPVAGYGNLLWSPTEPVEALAKAYPGAVVVCCGPGAPYPMEAS